MAEYTGNIRIGTCSWKFPSWHGRVYSAPKGINYLKEYALQFDTVEIDQWFWSLFQGHEPRLPDPYTVETYRRSVSDHFKFTIKVPNSITLTHYYNKSKKDPLVQNPHFLSPALFENFLSQIDAFKGVLGPLLFQFEYLNKNKMPDQKQFLDALETFIKNIPQTIDYAIEVRNPQYINAAYFDFLLSGRLSPVFLEGYWMPAVKEIYHRLKTKITLFKTVVLRLHGFERENMEKKTKGNWDRLVATKDDDLKNISKIIMDLAGQGADVFVNVNNHYEGSAPLTIERIQKIISI